MSGVFTEGIKQLTTIVEVIGGGVAAWGCMNLLEGYGGDNPGSKSQGIKQVIAGGGIYLIGAKVISAIKFA
ncbi:MULTISPECIES: Maff2 family mobile element protein [Butyrivibrio]|uniref:Maff2 family protein n=1 Tax=Butyrivibrio fibrisolvens TaxID=831 RepID=A0A1H9VIH1_BUTFI|nr:MULTISPECIES: Maff2 family protein [Butyrivibrio]SES21369.1 Maff2 family protein [Butyrivibrio fibrisolvens]